MQSYNDNNWPGKFENCANQNIGRYLNDLAIEGFYEEQEGSVTEPPFRWMALIIIEDVPNSSAFVQEDLKPAYILTEDEHGFVSYDEFDNVDDARIYWADDVVMA